MKKVIAFTIALGIIALCYCAAAAATNDYIWSQKPASGPLVSRNLAPTVGRIIGFPTSINSPETIIIGSGLTLTGSTLTASGGAISTLSDVTLTSIASGDFLKWNGTAWINRTAVNARTDLGLGTIATQAASAVAITGGTLSGITSFAIASTGTFNATSAASLRLPNAAIGSSSSLSLVSVANGGSGYELHFGDKDGVDRTVMTLDYAQTPTNKTISGATNTITNLNASNLSSGTVATARLGSGTADSTTYLRGDSTWAAAGGKVKQIVYAVKTDAASSATTTWASSGFTATITPTSASSRIMVIFSGSVGGQANYLSAYKMTRNGTDIAVGDTAGSRTSAQFGGYGFSSGQTSSATIICRDSPATTSATTYQMEWITEAGSLACINRSYADTNAYYGVRGASFIWLVEIED